MQERINENRLKIMYNIYGYISNSGDFIETGKTEKGAKIAAKLACKNGIANIEDLVIGYRSYINNMFVRTGSYCHIMEQWLKTVYY